jgi:hypothetical protein
MGRDALMNEQYNEGFEDGILEAIVIINTFIEANEERLDEGETFLLNTLIESLREELG